MNEPDAPALLAHVDFVRSLARALVADPADGDDLGQAALVAALERPAAIRTSLKQWLSGVVRKLAAARARGDARRSRREARVARAEATQGATIDDVARLELTRRLIDEVERLDPAQRTVVLMRFFEELPPRTIAERLAIPVNTVNTRLQRALARLRERMDADDRTRRDWRAALLAWIGRESPPTPLLTRPIAAASLVAAVGSVIVLLWIAWPSAEPPTVTASASNSTGASAAPIDPNAAADVAAGDRVEESKPAARAEATLLRVRGVVAGLDGDAPWKSGLVIVPLVERWSGERTTFAPAAEVAPVRASVGVDGAFVATFDLPPATAARWNRLDVRGDDASYLPLRGTLFVPESRADVKGDGAIECAAEFHAFRAAWIRGRVVDESGAPIADAGITLHRVNGTGIEARPLESASSDDDGAYAVRTAATGELLLVAQTKGAERRLFAFAPEEATRTRLDGRRPAARTLFVARGGEAMVEPLVLERGATIRGRVTMNGKPAAGALVKAQLRELDDDTQPFFAWRGVARLHARFENAEAQAFADERGDFELAGLARAKHSLRVGSPTGIVVHEQVSSQLARDVDAPAEEVAIELTGALVELEVSGDGVADALPMGSVALTSLHAGGYAGGALRDGRFATFLVPAHAQCDVTATTLNDGRSATSRITSPTNGETVHVALEIGSRLAPAPAIRLFLRDPEARPIRRASWRHRDAPVAPPVATPGGLTPWSPDGIDDPGFTKPASLVADDGRFLLTGLAPGHHWIEVEPDGRFFAGDSCFERVAFEVDVPADGTIVEVERTAQPIGRLFLCARDPAGRLLDAMIDLRDAENHEVRLGTRWRAEFDGGPSINANENGLANWIAAWPAEMTGEFDPFTRIEPPLRAGRYVVRFEHDDAEPVTREVEIRAGSIAVIEAVLPLRSH